MLVAPVPAVLHRPSTGTLFSWKLESTSAETGFTGLLSPLVLPRKVIRVEIMPPTACTNTRINSTSKSRGK